jgi:hypothetical protein
MMTVLNEKMAQRFIIFVCFWNYRTFVLKYWVSKQQMFTFHIIERSIKKKLQLVRHLHNKYDLSFRKTAPFQQIQLFNLWLIFVIKTNRIERESEMILRFGFYLSVLFCADFPFRFYFSNPNSDEQIIQKQKPSSLMFISFWYFKYFVIYM